jgi:hypothetical protein
LTLVILFPLLDQAVRQVRRGAHLKPFRDPFQGDGGFAAQDLVVQGAIVDLCPAAMKVARFYQLCHIPLTGE